MLRPLPAPKAAPDAARLRYYGQIQARVLSALCAPRAARGRIPRRLADHAGRLPRH